MNSFVWEMLHRVIWQKFIDVWEKELSATSRSKTEPRKQTLCVVSSSSHFLLLLLISLLLFIILLSRLHLLSHFLLSLCTSSILSFLSATLFIHLLLPHLQLCHHFMLSSIAHSYIHPSTSTTFSSLSFNSLCMDTLQNVAKCSQCRQRIS